MRTTAEVIAELETEAERFTHVALAVGFENTTLFIMSGEDRKISKLNQMIEQGGEPIGLCRASTDPLRRVTNPVD